METVKEERMDMAATKDKLRTDIERALRKYRKDGSRELPSVKKSVPRAFLNAVDALTEEIESALRKG